MMRHTLIQRPRRSRQRGVAAIEATIALPILFLMFYAVGEFGRLLYQYNQLNSLARNAARHMISFTSPNSTGALGISETIESQVRNMAVTGQLSGGTPLLRGLTADAVSINLIEGDPTDPALVDVATLSITYDWTPMFGESIPGFFGDAVDLSWDITATVTMRPL
ncbi:TadE/TadG family type IV pilus assembly protein [Ferrimonas balearica]|uniref:TadE/TadG family type IV pilus assembly protein n=1 Tax=Ferrimonas balearica TaxID=44012 RepID=UPI001C57B4AA|nr:TadE family protein [Ferrimonas balearica]MBW3162963.1 pilus assembly protein [Ferrimonas balearica]